jgi:hypothetical protein
MIFTIGCQRPGTEIFFLPLDFFFSFYYKRTKLVSMSPLEFFGNKILFL